MLRRSRRGAAHASSPPSGAEAATEGDAGSDSDEGSPGGGSPRAPRLRGAARRKAGARASVAWLASQAAHGDDGDGAGSLFAEDVLAGVAAAAQHEGEARGRRDARLRPKVRQGTTSKEVRICAARDPISRSAQQPPHPNSTISFPLPAGIWVPIFLCVALQSAPWPRECVAWCPPITNEPNPPHRVSRNTPPLHLEHLLKRSCCARPTCENQHARCRARR